MIYLDIVRRALSELESSNNHTRRAAYQQLRAGLSAALDEQDPQPSAQERTIEMRLLEMTIRQVENDLRAEINVMAEDYEPAALEAEQKRLYGMKERSRQRSVTTVQPQADVKVYAEQLLAYIAPISNGKSSMNFHENSMRLGTLLAVTLRMIRNQSAAQGKLGLLWLILEPLVLVIIIVSGYLLIGEKSVVNMPLITFAVTGIVPWLMMRSTISRVGASFTSNRDILSLPAVNMLTVCFSAGFVQFMIYGIGLFVALFGLIIHGDSPAPDNWPKSLIIFIFLWLYSLAFGMILGSYAVTKPFILRFAALSLRFLGFISSVFIVSEQFPEDLKFYTLLNPLSHGFQLLRGAYFQGYQSTDANISYFIFWLMFAMAVAISIEWARRPLLEPL